MDKIILEQIGHFLDTVMTLNVHFKYLKGDTIGGLFQKCKTLLKINQNSLSIFVARDIINKIQEKDKFLILTGWPILPAGPFGEMDGPPGAVVLSKAINQSCKAIPVFVHEEAINKVIIDACRLAGMSVLEIEEALKAGNACSIINYPLDTNEEKNANIHSKILDSINPSYVIAIERPGMNEKGQYHTRWGANVSEGVAKIDYLFKEAKRRGIPTLAIGDCGNELGMGKIKETLFDLFPEGKKCKCPCSGSIAGIIESDITFISTVCNWGAYAITAGLAVLKEDPTILHDGVTEKRILLKCAENGAIDTSIMAPRATPESLSLNFHCNLVELIKEVVERGILGTSGL